MMEVRLLSISKKEIGIIILLGFNVISPILFNLIDVDYYLWIQGVIFLIAMIPIYIGYKEDNNKRMYTIILLLVLLSFIISGVVSATS